MVGKQFGSGSKSYEMAGIGDDSQLKQLGIVRDSSAQRRKQG